jgi:predicted HicB family RNase H-like nuclease
MKAAALIKRKEVPTMEDQKKKVSEAQRRAVAKYNAANYDRVELRLDKGRKEAVKAHAETQGESLNAFINRAILETMERDAVK